jgi:hypothetical protein
MNIKVNKSARDAYALCADEPEIIKWWSMYSQNVANINRKSQNKRKEVIDTATFFGAAVVITILALIYLGK